MNLKLSFNIKKFIPQNPKTKNNILIIFLVFLALIGFIIFYNTFFKSEKISIKIEETKSISGKKITSSEASEQVINKIKKDIKRIQEELNNGFYSKLREYKPSGEIIIKPGRKNPFVL